MGDVSKKSDFPLFVEFENLFINNDNIAKIEAYLNRFNPIRVMKMERMEIRHSRILGWLLNPIETHGLGDAFLKAFLAEAFRGARLTNKPSALDIMRADLSKADIRVEWNNIDIFVFCTQPNQNWAFIIENKFDSTQSENQLTKYRKKLSKHFQVNKTNAISMGVFLTLWDEAPDDDEYVSINYESVFELLQNQLLLKKDSINRNAQNFIEQYLDVIGEATEMNEDDVEMGKLAMELYREHRKVIDFIVENGSRTDFVFAVEDLVGTKTESYVEFSVEGEKYIFFENWSEGFSFMPLNWYKGFGKGDYEFQFKDESWWEDLPVICWFQLGQNDNGGKLRLYAEVGPLTDYEYRKRLIQEISSIKSKKVGFQNGATQEHRKYSKFLKSNSVQIEDVNDSEILAEAMKNMLKSFSKEFKLIGNLDAVKNGKKMGQRA